MLDRKVLLARTQTTTQFALIIIEESRLVIFGPNHDIVFGRLSSISVAIVCFVQCYGGRFKSNNFYVRTYLLMSTASRTIRTPNWAPKTLPNE